MNNHDSIEALWIAEFGDYTNTSQLENGGVIVFESGRIFGGDSGMSYVGQYRINNDILDADIEIERFNEHYEDVFGTGSDKLNINAHGTRIDNNIIKGTLTSPHQSSLAIPFRLKRHKNLP